MNGPDREFLEDTAARIVDTREDSLKRDRLKRFWLGLLANALVTTFILVPTLVIVTGILGRESEAISNRIDRNAELTACILLIEPENRTPANIRRCLESADQRLTVEGG